MKIKLLIYTEKLKTENKNFYFNVDANITIQKTEVTNIETNV